MRTVNAGQEPGWPAASALERIGPSVPRARRAGQRRGPPKPGYPADRTGAKRPRGTGGARGHRRGGEVVRFSPRRAGPAGRRGRRGQRGAEGGGRRAVLTPRTGGRRAPRAGRVLDCAGGGWRTAGAGAGGGRTAGGEAAGRPDYESAAGRAPRGGSYGKTAGEGRGPRTFAISRLAGTLGTPGTRRNSPPWVPWEEDGTLRATRCHRDLATGRGRVGRRCESLGRKTGDHNPLCPGGGGGGAGSAGEGGRPARTPGRRGARGHLWSPPGQNPRPGLVFREVCVRADFPAPGPRPSRNVLHSPEACRSQSPGRCRVAYLSSQKCCPSWRSTFHMQDFANIHLSSLHWCDALSRAPSALELVWSP